MKTVMNFGQPANWLRRLNYTDFRNFLSVIEKAKEACKNSGQEVENHLVEFNEMVSIGSGAEREMNSFKLSRYACSFSPRLTTKRMFNSPQSICHYPNAIVAGI